MIEQFIKAIPDKGINDVAGALAQDMITIGIYVGVALSWVIGLVASRYLHKHKNYFIH
jgi:hypothetical protein